MCFRTAVLLLALVACGSRPAAQLRGQPGGTGGAAAAGGGGGAGDGGSGGAAVPGGSGGSAAGAGGAGADGGFEEGWALGLEITLDPACDPRIETCPGRQTGFLWIAPATDDGGNPALRYSSRRDDGLVPIVDGAANVRSVTVSDATESLGFQGETRIFSELDLQISVELLQGDALRVLAAAGGEANLWSSPVCSDVVYIEDARVHSIRTVPFEQPSLAIRTYAGRDPPLPGDTVFVETTTSGFDPAGARLAGVPIPAIPRGPGTLQVDLAGHLGLGRTATLAVEGLDISGEPFLAELPIATLAPEPGERGEQLDRLDGYAAQGVELVERGELPGSGARVVVSGRGRLAFELDVPADASSLGVDVSSLARWEPGFGPTLDVSVLAGDEHDRRSFAIAEPTTAITPRSIPLGLVEHVPVEVTLASDVEQVRFDLRPWAGRHAVVVLSVDGVGEPSLGCPPPETAAVLHRIAVLRE